MLVLTLREGEAVVIKAQEGLVKVTAVRLPIQGKLIRLGFEAPRDMLIYREKIWDAIQKEGENTTKVLG